VGLLLVGLSLFTTNRRLFFKIVPIVAIVVAYVAAFWNQTDTVLGEPARAFKSQLGYTSLRDERSDIWRELERQNITQNIQSAPLTGLGFGRPYRFFVEQPTLVGTRFVYWTYITHNAIFWVWMKMGAIGFVAFWFLRGSAIVQGLVTFRHVSTGTYVRSRS
jgi:O-antigen ligase